MKANTVKPAKILKWNYVKVIQGNYAGNIWEDASEYEATSTGKTKDPLLLQKDLKEYRFMGYPHRVIFRKTKINQ